MLVFASGLGGYTLHLQPAKYTRYPSGWKIYDPVKKRPAVVHKNTGTKNKCGLCSLVLRREEKEGQSHGSLLLECRSWHPCRCTP